MALIDPGTLDTLRDLSEDAMPDTVTVISFGPVTSTTGGGKVAGSITETATIGRLSVGSLNQSDREAERAGQIRQAETVTLAIPATTIVSGTDMIRVASARYGETRTYTIEEVVPFGSYSVHRTLILTPAVT